MKRCLKTMAKAAGPTLPSLQHLSPKPCLLFSPDLDITQLSPQ